MKTVLLILAFLNIALFAQWEKQVIDNNLPNAYELDVADIDKDGD